MENFLPQGYEAPQTGGRYLKFAQGANKFRILGNAILGWEDWIDNKPVRSIFAGPDSKPKAHDQKRSVKHFWAFPVWNYKTSQIEILEITQRSIQDNIQALFKDTAWGSPFKYDITVTKSGEDLETKYATMPAPPSPISEEIKAEFDKTPIDLSALFSGGDPFDAKPTPAQQMAQVRDQEVEIEKNVEKIPF